MKKTLLLFVLMAAALVARAEDYRIAVIPKGTTHEFWKSIHAGAVKASRELQADGINAEIIWKGPLREDDREQQVQVVENFIARRVSGIVLAPLDARALVAPAETAVRVGIPVVIIDSGLNSTKPISTVSTDNYKGGVLGAHRLATLLNGEGKVILLRVLAGSTSTEQREAGFLDTIQKEYPGITVISSDQHAGATRDTAYRAAQNLLNRFGRDVTGVFAPNESSATGMLLALRDAGLAGGKVKFVGFDTGTQTLAALKTGDLQGLVVQNPFKMGYLGVKTIVASLRGQTVDKDIDTGCELVTLENLNDPATIDLITPPLSKYLD
jgi:ribose transport system substrate-binding protein|uniref:ABC transporter substrate-binding protein n=1 Tax=Cephaloticoccus sp. TaxID=1985742 RepID=UPI00404A36A6